MSCSNCGKNPDYKLVFPIDANLAKTWGLSKTYVDLFNKREGMICKHCGVNARAQGLASAILSSKFGFGAQNLVQWVAVANKKKLRVCELNSCHELHKTLKKLRNYTFAEYGTKTQQDIENLTYPDNQFDLVLHSETLEHVNDPIKAMNECRRVIANDGLVLFSVPIIWLRKTRQRAKRTEGTIDYLLPPSHHGYVKDDYLVYYEFGGDAGKILRASVGFVDRDRQNYIFSSTKQGAKTHIFTSITMKLLEASAVIKEKATRT